MVVPESSIPTSPEYDYPSLQYTDESVTEKAMEVLAYLDEAVDSYQFGQRIQWMEFRQHPYIDPDTGEECQFIGPIGEQYLLAVYTPDEIVRLVSGAHTLSSLPSVRYAIYRGFLIDTSARTQREVEQDPSINHLIELIDKDYGSKAHRNHTKLPEAS